MKTTYPQEIIDRAREIGYKAANLDFLSEIARKFNARQASEFSIEVPKHVSIKSREIVSHLDKFTPTWREKWQEFVRVQETSKEGLSVDAIAKLHEIQELIKVAFSDANQFTIDGLNPSVKQMVRSTGDEDRVDVANPGGNESVPSDHDSISSSMGIVIASYFSEKSMAQRLKSGENITSRPPLMPCLIQELIGNNSNDRTPSVSGVIYTSEKSTRIDASHGHGELVVNSKGNFDKFFVTTEDVVHPYIGDKTIRIDPKLNPETGKLELEEVENFEFAKLPSLSEEQAMNLARFAQFVQEEYGMRMDIEFVFDTANNKINIVQARPIPEGKRKGMAPSALSNSFITQHKPEQVSGEVITTEVLTSKVIESPSQIMIRPSIDQALKDYLNGNSKEYRAIVVGKTAPDTSHEAGFFASQGIPVLYTGDYAQTQKWTSFLADNVLVIDPQHSAIYNIPRALYQDNIIEEGMFRSTLAEYETPSRRSFMEGPSREMPQIKAKTIGELVLEARDNPDATQKLFQFVRDEIGIRETKLYDSEDIKESLKKLLVIPSSKESFQEHREILGDLLQYITSIKNEKEISSPTFEQIIIDGYELHKSLKELEYDPTNKEARANYLNLHQKFTGILTSKGRKGILSTSLNEEISKFDQKTKLKHEIKQRGYDLTTVNEDTFLDLVRHKSHFIDPVDAENWVSFCYKTAQSPEDAAKLKGLLTQVTKLDVKDFWLNIEFTEIYQKHQDNVLSHLDESMHRSLVASGNILAATKRIDQLEHQIAQWADPKKFNSLFNENYQKNILEILDLLKLDPNDQISSSIALKQLYRLVDAIDLSIKQLQNSPNYEDKKVQVENFKKMIGVFFQAMKHQVGDAHPSRITAMNDYFHSQEGTSIRELEPSREFSVVQSNFYQNENSGGFQNFLYLAKENKLHLADMYTLVHQTSLSSISIKSREISNKYLEKLPSYAKETGKLALAKYDFPEDYAKTRSLSISSQYNIANGQNELLYVNENYPYITLHYNVPLRNHSGSLKLNFNINTKKIELDFHLFGGNVDNRWQVIERNSIVFSSLLTDAKIISHHSDEQIFNIKLEISPKTNSLREIFKIINMAADLTFMPSDGSLQDPNSLVSRELKRSSMPILFTEKLTSDDFQNLSETLSTFKSLKENPSSTLFAEVERKEFIRLLSLDESRALNAEKLKQVQENIAALESESNFSISNYMNKYSPDLSITAMRNLIGYFSSIGDHENTKKIAEAFSHIDYERLDYSVKKYADSAISSLIEHKLTEYVLPITSKMYNDYSLSKVVNIFIKNKDFENAATLIARITDHFYLKDISLAYLSMGEDKKFFELSDRLNEDYLIETIKILLKNEKLEMAEKLIDKITKDENYAELAGIFLENGYSDKGWEFINKVKDKNYLSEVGEYFLYNKDIESFEKLLLGAGKAEDLFALAASYCIIEDQLQKAAHFMEQITTDKNLSLIASSLIEKGLYEESYAIIDRMAASKTTFSTIIELLSSRKNSEDEKFFLKTFDRIIDNLQDKLYVYDDKIFDHLINNNDVERFRKLAIHIENGDILLRKFKKALHQNNLEIANIILDNLNIDSSYEMIEYYKKAVTSNFPELADKLFQKLPNNEDYLLELSHYLIQAGKYDQALKVTEKISEEYIVTEIVEALIKDKQYDNAFQITSKISSGYQLEKIATEFIEHNQPELAFKIADKITEYDGYYLKGIILKLIEKDQPDFAIELSNKVKHSSHLFEIVNKALEHNQPELAFKIADKITEDDGYYLNDIILKLIEKDQPENAFKLTDSIKHTHHLYEIGKNFISNNYPEIALKIGARILSTDDLMKEFYSYSIAQELIKSGELEIATQLVQQFPESSNYLMWANDDIAQKAKELKITAELELSPKSAGSWSILPTAEAINESSYRKIDDPWQAEIDSYRSYKHLDSYKSSEFGLIQHGDLASSKQKTFSPTRGDIKLPETDLTAVAVIAARAAKFMTSKLLAKPEASRSKTTRKQKAKKGTVEDL